MGFTLATGTACGKEAFTELSMLLMPDCIAGVCISPIFSGTNSVMSLLCCAFMFISPNMLKTEVKEKGHTSRKRTGTQRI